MYKRTTLFRGPCRSFPFSHFSSHFLFSFGHFLSLFGATTHSVKRRKFPPHFLKSHVWPSIFHLYSLFLYFLFYDIINHMASCEPWDSFPTHANCEPFLFVPSVTLLWCHVASPNISMCHPTPHASKNVKSRPPRNPTKFDMVAKFRERISTKKSVSSSKI